jgi:transcriptional regulator with XRE-family HTH domain
MISGFHKKIIVSKLTLGQTLKRARLKKKLSLKTAAQATLVRLSHLQDLENDNFASLPQEPYGSFFVKTYSQFLGLSSREMVAWFHRAANIIIEDRELQAPQEIGFSIFSFLRSRLRTILVGLVLIAGVTSFMAYEVAGMTQGPSLTVVAPSQNEIAVTSPIYKITGVADEQASVYIDGTLVDQNNGSFSQDVVLQKGMNTVLVEAKDSLGKTTDKTFSILRK